MLKFKFRALKIRNCEVKIIKLKIVLHLNFTDFCLFSIFAFFSFLIIAFLFILFKLFELKFVSFYCEFSDVFYRREKCPDVS